MKMSSHLKAELAATCSMLGHLHKGEYLIEPECIESVKDLIRYLRRDNESHEIRRYLGESKILQNDLIHIVMNCPSDMPELLNVTLRLLINLTTPAMLFYGEELPTEKIGRNIYLSLIGYGQDYKNAFCDVEFWNKISGKLSDLFEIDWTERSADDGIHIERILMLLRNVLQIPADVENEKRPENDITVHDKVLWALRQSQILELLLLVSSKQTEEQYYLNLLEIFSLILREQNPKVLAQCEVGRLATEKNRDVEELARARELEKKNQETQNRYLNMRNFNATFVMKGIKSISNNDVVCHKPLDKIKSLNVSQSKKQIRVRKNKIPIESENIERRSTFSVRLFLKEFCLEFLTCSFNNLMNVVKNRLDSGKSLAHDQTYYFWALKFFLDFTVASNLDVNLIKGCLSMESFHFIQTSMDHGFEHLLAEKKKTVDWVKRIHLILKAYRSLLETLFWMDCSKNPLVRAISREIKSEIFYVVEYREMTLHLLLKYDSTRFSVSYLRDLVETTHLFIKLLEEYSKQTKLVVQKMVRKKMSKKRGKREEVEVDVETKDEKWNKIKDEIYDILSSENLFPEIPPFDATLEIPIDDQKGRAMKNIQKFLHDGKIRDGIGLLRSSRQVWPQNDYFGVDGMSVEDETMALQEICLADLENVEGGEDKEKEERKFEVEEEEDGDDEDEDEDRTQMVEQDFNILDYIKRLVNKKVVEGCGILLKNYNKNSDHTNHCTVKLLHRIGWECSMPAMLYQASLFWTLLKIMNDKSRNYDEINTFTLNLLRRFRKHASNNPVVFLELLFWKEHNTALEIQHGYIPYEDKEKPKKRSKKKKSKHIGGNVSDDEHSEEEMNELSRKECDVIEEVTELGENVEKTRKDTKKRNKKSKSFSAENSVKIKSKSQKKKKKTTEMKDVNNPSRTEVSVTEPSFHLTGNKDDFDSEDDLEDTFHKNRSSGSVMLFDSTIRNETESDKSDDEVQNYRSGGNKALRRRRSDMLLDSSENEVEDSDNMDRKGFDSSDEENDGMGSRNKEENSELGGSQGKEEEASTQATQKHEETFQSQGNVKPMEEPFADLNSGNESDQSNDVNQASRPSSKKRMLTDSSNKIAEEEKDSDEGGNSKWKRRRFVSSDSDVENRGSEEDGPILTKKSSKRALVIDSDSDLEFPSANDNCIRSSD